jgi:hypothetical protein
MTRVIGAFVLGLVLGSVCISHGQQEPSDDTIAAADEAGVSAIDLQGALNTTHMDARTYLCVADGLLCPAVSPAVLPAASCGWPICGALGQRLWCIEAIESAHGRFMWNPVGLWYGNHVEHAQGWLGFMPTTAATWGAQIGNRASEWAAAARMIAAGRGSAFAGIATGRC